MHLCICAEHRSQSGRRCCMAIARLQRPRHSAHQHPRDLGFSRRRLGVDDRSPQCVKRLHHHRSIYDVVVLIGSCNRGVAWAWFGICKCSMLSDEECAYKLNQLELQWRPKVQPMVYIMYLALNRNEENAIYNVDY